MARLTARRDIVIDAPPDVVWKIHTDINMWSQWHTAISAARTLVAPDVGSVFEWKSGGIAIRSTIRIWQPERRISWTGKAMGTRAEHTWTLELQDGSTLVTTEESMEGWLVSFLRVIAPSFLEKSLDVWLRDLKSAAEGPGAVRAAADTVL